MLIDLSAESITISPQTFLDELNKAFQHGRSVERDSVVKFIEQSWVHPVHVEPEWLLEKINEGAHESSE